MAMQLTDVKIEQLTKALIERINPYSIYLFGSFATGLTHPNSDIDLAYLSNKTISHYERFLIAQELSNLINLDIDLIDLHEASTVFQVQIIAKGKILYCSEGEKRQRFEMVALKNYAMLNEERKGILDKIDERGKILE
jgi:uncharacterized protein